MLKMKMYSPSKRRFKHVISMNTTHEYSDVNLDTNFLDVNLDANLDANLDVNLAANLASEKDHALTDESEYSEWNGFSSDVELSDDDASTNPAASFVSSEQQERDNPTSTPEYFADALDYQPNEGPIDEDLVDLNSGDESFDELPTPLSVLDWAKQQLNEDADGPVEENLVDINSGDESLDELPTPLSILDRAKQRPGKKRNTKFASPPNGELQHPYLEWQLDKASMDMYMTEYAKQEGFAVNAEKEHKGTVIRWRCMYAGKYKNHRNLSSEIGRQDIPMNNGISP